MHSACRADLSLYSWKNQAFNSIKVIAKDRNKDTVDRNHNNLAVAGKNFDVATVIALSRMAERGDIDSSKTDGKRRFKKKDISEFK